MLSPMPADGTLLTRRLRRGRVGFRPEYQDEIVAFCMLIGRRATSMRGRLEAIPDRDRDERIRGLIAHYRSFETVCDQMATAAVQPWSGVDWSELLAQTTGLAAIMRGDPEALATATDPQPPAEQCPPTASTTSSKKKSSGRPSGRSGRTKA